MNGITEERIDAIIDNAFIEQNENVLNDFINNYEKYKRIFDKVVRDNVPDAPSDYAERFTGEFSIAFASFKLAQDNCINIFRETLKELLCE